MSNYSTKFEKKKPKTIDQFINTLLKNPAVLEMSYKTNNQVELSGWIIFKPKFIKHDIKGIESCSLPLYQITNSNGNIKLESFYTMVYVKDLVEQLKENKNIIFVATMGKIRHHYQYGDYVQITEMKTIIELEMPLFDRLENAKV